LFLWIAEKQLSLGMDFFSGLFMLIRKEFILEFRMKYALNSLILYAFSCVYICYLAYEGHMNYESWNALFWIIFVFASVNAISKAFVQEGAERHAYYYFILKPRQLILARMIYNSLLLLFLSMISFLFFSIFMGSISINPFFFLAGLILGSLGFSAILSLVASIASAGNNRFSLMAVLSFPLVLPLMIMLINMNATPDDTQHMLGFSMALLLFDVIVWVLSSVLFPYLWKE